MPYKSVVYELYLFTNALIVGIHRSSRIIGFNYHDPSNHVVIMKSVSSLEKKILISLIKDTKKKGF